MPLEGDVASLCAAACVSKAWNAAATRDARVWCRLVASSPDVATKLTDERLALLLGRSAGALERIDLTGCDQLTPGAIADALAGARDTLTHVSVAFTAVSACAVLGALDGRETPLACLSVRGITRFDEEDDDDEEEARDVEDEDDELVGVLAALMACVGRGEELLNLHPRRQRMEFYTVRITPYARMSPTARTGTFNYAKHPRLYGVDEENDELVGDGVVLPSNDASGLDVSGVCASRLCANGNLAYGHGHWADEGESLEDAVRTCRRLCGGAAARAMGDIQCSECQRWVCSSCVPKLYECNIHNLLLCNSCMRIQDGCWCSDECYWER